MKLSQLMKIQFITNIIADLPKTDYIEEARDFMRKDSHAELPSTIKDVLADPLLAVYLTPKYIHYKLPEGSSYISVQISNITYTLKGSSLTHVQNLLRKQDQQNLEIGNIRERINGLLKGITTDTKLKEAFPEFLKYIPDIGITEGTKNLPVGESLYTQLSQMGFPKSEKSNAK